MTVIVFHERSLKTVVLISHWEISCNRFLDLKRRSLISVAAKRHIYIIRRDRKIIRRSLGRH